MTSGRPDYTVPVSIEAITIETLPIDIAAQTIGNININIASSITLGVDITAQTVGDVSIDIAAQSLGNIDVNLAASAVTLNVDITAQSLGDISIEIAGGVSDIRRGYLVNPSFEEGEVGWRFGGAAAIDSASGHTGTKSVKFSAGELAQWINQSGITPPIDTDKLAAFKITQAVSDLSDKSIVTVHYADGTSENTTLTNTEVGSWETHDVDYTAGKFIVDVRVAAPFCPADDLWIDSVFITYTVDQWVTTIGTVDVDITAQTLETLSIDIAAQSLETLNINIAAQADNVDVNIAASDITINVKTGTGEHVDTDIVSSVTLDVDVTAQSVGDISVDITAQSVGNIDINIAASAIDINIKTSGGANIVIDQLTQTAYTERRSTISNNGESASWMSISGNARRGKFFPRGLRGFISTVDVYCYDTAAAGGTITVYLSPHPSMGYLYSAAVTVPAGGSAAWRSATFNKMWNYDSLFIFVVCSVADLRVAYDDDEDYDAYGSADAGASWSDDGLRCWFRVAIAGETIGDLPVSGTLNTIEIPHVTGAFTTCGQLNLDGGNTWNIISTIYGAGKLLGLQVSVNRSAGSVPAANIRLYIVVDGASHYIPFSTLGETVNKITKTISPFSFAEFDETADAQKFAVAVNFHISFNRSLRVYISNTAAAGNKVNVYAVKSYELMT